MNAVVTAAAREETFNAQRLEAVFGACFAARWRTRLVGGAGEPFYQPARSAGEYHLLHYRLDYFASALHEVAHWCIAGTRRRRLPDFGYWYAPDGREPVQQRAFEALTAHDTGVLAATTAFGKTVVASALIGHRARNTLVLVHRRELLDQWVERLKTFLQIDPKQIGTIGGGKRKPTGVIDVALIQSLVRNGEVDDIVAFLHALNGKELAGSP